MEAKSEKTQVRIVFTDGGARLVDTVDAARRYILDTVLESNFETLVEDVSVVNRDGEVITQLGCEWDLRIVQI